MTDRRTYVSLPGFWMPMDGRHWDDWHDSIDLPRYRYKDGILQKQEHPWKPRSQREYREKVTRGRS